MAKRVYFAFHYQDVIDFRANVVRKHNFTGGVETAGYYDHSIWETAKKNESSGSEAADKFRTRKYICYRSSHRFRYVATTLGAV